MGNIIIVGIYFAAIRITSLSYYATAFIMVMLLIGFVILLIRLPIRFCQRHAYIRHTEMYGFGIVITTAQLRVFIAGICHAAAIILLNTLLSSRLHHC